MSENQQMQLAQGAMNLNLPPDFIMERYLNIENPDQLTQRWYRWQVRLALMQQVIAKTQAYAGELAQQLPAATQAGLAERISNLPPEAMAALAQNKVPEALQAAANVRRTGVMPSGIQTGSMAGELMNAPQ